MVRTSGMHDLQPESRCIDPSTTAMICRKGSHRCRIRWRMRQFTIVAHEVVVRLSDIWRKESLSLLASGATGRRDREMVIG
jgi:hypothetical protein